MPQTQGELKINKTKFFRKLNSISARLTLTAGVLIFLAAGLGYLSLQSAGTYRSDAETITSLAKRVNNVFETRNSLYRMVRAEKDFVLTAEDKFKNERIVFSQEFDKRLNELISGSFNDESRILLQEIKNKKVEYDKNFEMAVGIYEPFTTAGGFGDITNLTAEEDLTQREATQKVKELSLANTSVLLTAETEFIGKVIIYDVGQIDGALAQAGQSADLLRLISIAAIIVALAFGFILAFFVIRSINRTFRGAVEELAGISEILSDSSKQQSEVAGRTSTVASQLASGAMQQSKQSEEMSGMISQMASAITQMSGTVQETAAGATNASQEAQQAGQGGEKAQQSLTKIKEVVMSSAGMIEQISGSYKEISNLVGEITGIADQTNILALNAAIEAARAGEAGRGFAVVADEVRRLAEGSRKFADEITDRIREATAQAEKTAAITSDGAKNIEESSEVISKTLSALQNIAQSVQGISAKIQEVSSNMQQQASSTEQISKTVSSIAAVGQQNASSAQEVSSAVDQQQIVVTTIDKSIEQLRILLQDMRVLIGLKAEEIPVIEEKTFAAPQPVAQSVRPEVEVETQEEENKKEEPAVKKVGRPRKQ